MLKTTDSRTKRLRALDKYRRSLPHVSQSALSAIVQEAKLGNIPDNVSRRLLYAAQQQVLKTSTIYGTVGQTLLLTPSAGGTEPVAIPIVYLPSLLRFAFSECKALRLFLMERHRLHPSSCTKPWRLLIYADEYNPGLDLVARHARKQWMVYAAFLEYGADALQREAAWMCLSAALTSITSSQVESDFSQLAGRLLQSIFCHRAHDPRFAGIELEGDGQALTLYFEFGGWVLDGLAHKLVFGTVGSTGHRSCVKCLNFYSVRSEIVQAGMDNLVCAFTDPSRLVFSTNADVYGSVDRLAYFKRTLLNDTVFKRRQQAIGFNHLPSGMLMMPELRDIVKPVEHSLTEPAHTIYINGVAGTTCYLWFEAMYKAPNDWKHSDIHDYLQHWTWPRGVGKTQMLEIFDRGRVKSWREAGHIKCHASELIALLPVLSYYAKRFVKATGVCPLETDAFIALIDMCDAIHLRTTDAVTPEFAYDKVCKFLAACVAAGWDEFMHPKFHWLLHLGWELVISALICEAKHRVPKRFAKDTVNLTSFDFGVLANVTGYHLSQLEDVDCFNFQASLVKPIRPQSQLAAFLRAEYPGATTFESSIEARLSGHGKVGRGDVVLADDGHGVVAAEVWALYAVDGAPRSLLSVWTKVSSSRDTSSAKWLRAHQPELWDIGDILCTCIYRDVGAEVLTLVPPAFVDRL